MLKLRLKVLIKPLTSKVKRTGMSIETTEKRRLGVISTM
jgi:hypothetical protein